MPEGLTTVNSWAFYYCTGLETLTLPSTLHTMGENAFDNCKGLSSILIPGSLKTIPKRAFNYCTGLEEVIISDGIEVVGEGAFNNCQTLKKVVMADSVKTLEKDTFYGCSKLSDIKLSNNLELIGDSAFTSGYALTNITIPDTVTTMGAYAFSYSGLTTIDIPLNVKSIQGNTFNGCKDLESINVNEENLTYSSLEGVLFSKDKKTLIFYPCGKKDTEYFIPNEVTTINSSSFSYITALETVIISGNITDLPSNFSGCTALKIIVVPDSVTTVNDFIFYGSDFTKIYTHKNSVFENRAKENTYKAYTDDVIFYLGDMDGDKIIEKSDSASVIRKAFDASSVTGTEKYIADANCDNAVDILDAVHILNRTDA